MKILLILLKFHEKTLTRPGDIKILCPGRMHMQRRPPEVFRNFANFAGKHLCQSLVRVSFLIKLQAPQLY